MSATAADRKTYLEVLANLLVADFQVTEEEHVFLNDTAARLELSAADLAEVLGRVNMGADISPIAAKVPPALHSALLADLEQAAMCDGELAAREQVFINAVKAALKS